MFVFATAATTSVSILLFLQCQDCVSVALTVKLPAIFGANVFRLLINCDHECAADDGFVWNSHHSCAAVVFGCSVLLKARNYPWCAVSILTALIFLLALSLTTASDPKQSVWPNSILPCSVYLLTLLDYFSLLPAIGHSSAESIMSLTSALR